MSSLMRVRATKIELIKLRRRRDLAKKVHRILRERLTILVNESLTRVKEAYNFRMELNKYITSVYNKAILLTSIYGDKSYSYLRSSMKRSVRVYVGHENIMGVRSISAIVKEPEIPVSLAPGLDEFSREAVRIITMIIDLGRTEQAIISLGREIGKTKRKVNALEYIVIPRLERTIRYLSMKFEEREREEKARLKRVKSMLEKKRGKT